MSHTLAVTSAALPDALEPVRLSGHEGLSALFEYELVLKTPDALNFSFSQAADIDLDALIGCEISCSIELDGAGEFAAGVVGGNAGGVGAGTRQINALIAGAQLWGEEGRHIQYKLTLRPWLHLATLSTDCKIYQNKTVVGILDELFADYSFPVDKHFVETYPARDYQTQFNESDLAFFERLCQEWGISYHFRHSDGKHRLVLTDNMGAQLRNGRSELWPEVPTLTEQGVPGGVDFDVWFGVVAPAKTPAPVVKLLGEKIAKITAEPAFRKRLNDLGGVAPATGNTPEAFADVLKRELAILPKAAQEAGLQLD